MPSRFADQAAGALLGDNLRKRTSCAPTHLAIVASRAPAALRAIGLVPTTGVWPVSEAATGRRRVGFSYTSGGANLNLTGSPVTPRASSSAIPARMQPTRKQFNTARSKAMVGRRLESGNGAFEETLHRFADLSDFACFRFGKGRNVQLRLDLFNAFNRRSSAATHDDSGEPGGGHGHPNLAYDRRDRPTNNGVNLLSTGIEHGSSLPKNAGFGVANVWQYRGACRDDTVYILTAWGLGLGAWGLGFGVWVLSCKFQLSKFGTDGQAAAVSARSVRTYNL